MQTLKTYGKWQLNKYSELKYFKNGRANMHMAISYCIEFDNAALYKETNSLDGHVETGIFWIKTKAEAMKEWSQFKKTHSIGGAELRSELFPIKRGA